MVRRLLTIAMMSLIVFAYGAGAAHEVHAESPASPPGDVLAAAFTTCSAQSEISEAECDALVALYNNTDGGQLG